jgi:hypothetical protein
VSRGHVRSSAATTEFRFGCDVLPLIDASARSTTSTPASAARMMLADVDAAGVVGVEVDRKAGLLRSVRTSFSAAYGRHSPAMSLMAMKCAPMRSSSFVMRT